jgi:hypothetical protein
MPIAPARKVPDFVGDQAGHHRRRKRLQHRHVPAGGETARQHHDLQTARIEHPFDPGPTGIRGFPPGLTRIGFG